MSNFAKTFLSGFNRGFTPTFGRTLNDRLFRGRQEDRNQFVLNQQEAQRQRQQRQFGQESDVIKQILSGEQTVGGDVTRGIIPDEFQAQLNKQQKTNLINQLPASGINRLNAITRLLAPEPQKTFSFGGELFEFKPNPENGRLEIDFDNPIAQKEIPERTTVPAETVEGREDFKGFSQTVDIMPDGTIKPVGNPFRPAKGRITTETGLSIQGLKNQNTKWETELRLRGNDVTKFNKLAQEIVDPNTGKIIQGAAFDRATVTKAREIHNDNMFRLEQKIFNDLLPRAKTVVNNLFTDLKAEFGGEIDERQAFLKSPELKEIFLEGIEEAYTNGELLDLAGVDTKGLDADEITELKQQIEAQSLRQLISWASAKFGVILPINVQAK